jgi:peptide/nickel transport system permease protein
MRFVDIWFSIPFILFALVVVLAFDPSLKVVLVLLGILAWSAFVRNIRAEVLLLKTTEYVAAARVSGASTLRIMLKHLLPGVFNTVMVLASLRVGQLILAEASLSFLGAGIPSPIPAWGVMVADGRNYLDTAWWVSTFPGLAILLTVMSFNFLGDWLRDKLDPRLRQVG